MSQADPREVRDDMIADYTTAVREHGVDPDRRDVERIVQSDLQTFEAVMREQRGQPERSQAVPDAHVNAGHAAAAEIGDAASFYRDDAPTDRAKHPLLDTNPMALARNLGWCTRFPFAMARMKRICQRAPASGARPKGIMAALGEAEVPALARDFFATLFDYQQHRGVFRGKSRIDAARIFVRKVEDIADKSTGKLGPWYVK